MKKKKKPDSTDKSFSTQATNHSPGAGVRVDKENQVKIQNPNERVQGSPPCHRFLCLSVIRCRGADRGRGPDKLRRAGKRDKGSGLIAALSLHLQPASEAEGTRMCAECSLSTLNEPVEYLDRIFYSALFITCVPLFHKGTEKERERERAGMMKMTISSNPKTAFLKLHS